VNLSGVRRTLPGVLASLLSLAAYAPAHAQDAKPATAPKAAPAPTPAQTAKPAPKPTSKPPAQAASCPKGTQCAKGGAARGSGVPPPTTAEEMVALEPASEAQMEAAEQVHYGKYVCDEKFEVFVERNLISKGYVDVRYKKDVWVMRPVSSATGAVRLEDTRGRVLLVQIPFKSMLLNTQTGQRIVDSCQHDVQKDAEREHKPEPSVLK